MRKQTHLAATLFLCVAFISANLPDHVSLYIGTYKDIAVEEMKRSGIPASIILAQGIHESAWGKGELALNSNNHFGIKCKDYWTGPKYYHKDDDYDENGNLLKSCFRAYDNSESSYLDHTDFLVNSPRYKNLFNYKHTDYYNWAKGLKKCGYATDPHYAEKLIRTIEKYNLHQYDRLLDTPEIQSAPTYTISQEDVQLPNLFIQQHETAEQDFTANYEVQAYEVPSAVVIPDNYQRVNYQAIYKEEPVEPMPVQPIPNEEYTYEEATIEVQEIVPEPEVINVPQPVEIVPAPMIEEVPEESTIAVHQESIIVQQPTINREAIIPVKRMKKQKNTLLGRKPRTQYTELR